MKKICKKYPNCFLDFRLKDIPVTKKTGKIKLVAFDMDGVLVDIGSSWQHIHNHFGTNNRKSVISYIKGEIDYTEFIRRDASLWTENDKPVNIKRLKRILAEAPLMSGAKSCIESLKKKDVEICIVSAGFDLLADRVSDELGIDHVFANGIGLDEKGFFNGDGNLVVELLYKDKIIFDISEEFGIGLENIASVGDSCFDIPMILVSGLGVAFNPLDGCIKDFSDVVVEGKNLFDVSSIIESYL